MPFHCIFHQKGGGGSIKATNIHGPMKAYPHNLFFIIFPKECKRIPDRSCLPLMVALQAPPSLKWMWGLVSILNTCARMDAFLGFFWASNGKETIQGQNDSVPQSSQSLSSDYLCSPFLNRPPFHAWSCNLPHLPQSNVIVAG